MERPAYRRLQDVSVIGGSQRDVQVVIREGPPSLLDQGSLNRVTDSIISCAAGVERL